MMASPPPATDATADQLPLELNPDLDEARFAAAFRESGRVHIPAILTEASARRLFQALAQETRWGLIVNAGDDSIGWISATATLHKPLDFLGIHDDGATNRRVAYVRNMTPDWRPDWGGALQFYDRDDHVEEGYLPTFNALNLFPVPKRHAVTQVASFGGLRYSVSGWFEPATRRDQARDPAANSVPS